MMLFFCYFRKYHEKQIVILYKKKKLTCRQVDKCKWLSHASNYLLMTDELKMMVVHYDELVF